MTLQNQGVAVAHLVAGVADGHGAGDVGGAVEILGAGVHQQQVSRPGPAVGLAGRAIVDHGPVGTGAGDGVEGQVPQLARGGAEALELCHRLDLVRRVRLTLRRQPVQELRHRRPVSDMGRAGPGDLHRVLGGPGQGAGVRAAHHHRTRRRHRVEIPGRGVGRVQQHPLARQRLQGGDQGFRRQQLGGVAQPRGQVFGDLVRVQKQPGLSVGADQGLAEGQGRADHVAAADVEQPGQRGRTGQHRHIGAGLGDGLGDAGALGGGGFAGQGLAMGPDGGLGLGRSPLPGQIQGIGVHRDQAGAGPGGGGLQPVQAVGGVQPGVVAHRLAGLQLPLQPERHAALHQVVIGEQPAVHLGADLQGVAAVGEHGRAVEHHHRRPGRAGEAGGEGQPVIGLGQVLVVVLVLVRDDQPVQPRRGHGLADPRQMLLAIARIGVIVEGLEHGGTLAWLRQDACRLCRSRTASGQPGCRARRTTRVAQASRRTRPTRRKPRFR